MAKLINNVGLDAGSVKPVLEELSKLLADYQVFYSNVRGLHWLIEGDQFFDFHPKYEEYYDDLAELVDTVAERILTIGGVPESRFSVYLKQSKVKEAAGISDPRKGVSTVLENLKLCVSQLRATEAIATKAGDLGTADMMVEHLRDLEKKIWMMSAYAK